MWKDKCGWCVAIKMKSRGRIKSIDAKDESTYQVDKMLDVDEIIKVKGISGLQDLQAELEEVHILITESF